MRVLILSVAAIVLVSCSTQRKVETVISDDINLSKTTATLSSDSSVLDMVQSLSYDFDSLEVCYIPTDTLAIPPGIVHLKARRASFNRNNSISGKQRSVAIVSDTMAAHLTTDSHYRESADTAKVYKPPNGTLVVLVLLLMGAAIIFFKLRSK